MSDLAKAFAGLKQAQVPEPLGTQVSHAIQHPRGAGGGQSKAFRRGLPITAELVDELIAPKFALPTGKLQIEARSKSKDPDYTPVKVFLRRKTHRVAARKWEDAEIGDFSDLVEHLLQCYLNT